MTLSPELLRAYRETSFIARVPQGEITIRVDECSPEVDALCGELGVGSWTFITAWNPRSEELPRRTNDARNDELLAALTPLGARVYGGRGVGTDPEWLPERSFLALGVDRETALALGRRFDQHAIVWGRLGEPAELVVCKG